MQPTDDAPVENTVEPTRYSLPVELLDAVMQNLAAQPYGEVADLIAAVQQQARPEA